jgi:hypothetical protein
VPSSSTRLGLGNSAFGIFRRELMHCEFSGRNRFTWFHASVVVTVTDPGQPTELWHWWVAQSSLKRANTRVLRREIDAGRPAGSPPEPNCAAVHGHSRTLAQASMISGKDPTETEERSAA